jgi:hypothetical protein
MAPAKRKAGGARRAPKKATKTKPRRKVSRTRRTRGAKPPAAAPLE